MQTTSATELNLEALLQPVPTQAVFRDPAFNIWRGADRYWAVVKDMHGIFTGKGCSLALFESAEGFDWKLAAHPLVTTLTVTWAEGRRQTLAALERPQLHFEDGQPAALFCAAAEDPSRDHSFNLQIPLSMRSRSGGICSF